MNPVHQQMHCPDEMLAGITFKVVDLQTGRQADTEEIVKEDWARNLVYTDIAGFAILEDGSLVLLDECGNFVHCPQGRFRIVCTG